MADIIDEHGFKLFSYEALTGRSVWVLHQDGKMIFRTDYPVENLIRENAAESAEMQGRRFGEFVRIASTPENIYESSGLAEAHLQGDKKFAAKFFNDGDNRAWRTRGGRI